jgi:hypothetical protein
MSKWFSANKLSLSLDKNKCNKIYNKNSPQYPSRIGCNDIEVAVNTKKFLRLTN